MLARRDSHRLPDRREPGPRESLRTDRAVRGPRCPRHHGRHTTHCVVGRPGGMAAGSGDNEAAHRTARRDATELGDGCRTRSPFPNLDARRRNDSDRNRWRSLCRSLRRSAVLPRRNSCVRSRLTRRPAPTPTAPHPPILPRPATRYRPPHQPAPRPLMGPARPRAPRSWPRPLTPQQVTGCRRCSW